MSDSAKDICCRVYCEDKKMEYFGATKEGGEASYHCVCKQRIEKEHPSTKKGVWF